MVKLESQSRRINLLFAGIKEKEGKETDKDCENSVRDIIMNTLRVQNGHAIQFDDVHRLGVKSPGKTRFIIAGFLSFKDREAVWKNRRNLSKSNYTLLEDFPAEIQHERKLLYPILKVAKSMEAVKSAYIKVDTLCINGKGYTTKSLNELPLELNLEKMFTQSKNGVTLFCSKYSPLSNLYSEFPIEIDNETYCSTEQYIQCTKATRFNDLQLAANIKAESDPYKIMALGKTVKNFDPVEWSQTVRNVLRKSNMAKFQQVAGARILLLENPDNMLGEATLDKTYGIGLHLTDPKATDPTNWTDNLFGNVLQEVRNELKKQYSLE